MEIFNEILAFVEKLLAYLGEIDVAGIVAQVEEFIAGLMA